MDEVWVDVPGYGGNYEASSFGVIASKDRVVRRFNHFSGGECDFFYGGRVLRGSVDSDGYLHVNIGVNGRVYSRTVHSIILLSFVGPRPDGLYGCHKDGNPGNNRPENLYCGSAVQNARDRLIHGRYAVGDDHKNTVISDAKVAEMRESGLHYEIAAKKYGVSRTQAHRIMRGKSRIGNAVAVL